MQAIGEQRVLNPRGTEPINVKSMFEVITGPRSDLFHSETAARTPWTRRFFERRTIGPQGEPIDDLVAWTRANWPKLVLKPERGYSGIGVKVGGVDLSGDDAVDAALAKGAYIVQEKVDLGLWGEAMPEIDHDRKRIALIDRQTDFRYLIGPGRVFGFLCRFGDAPTNVGSGGGVQPLAILQSNMTVREAVDKINHAIMDISFADLLEIEEEQNALTLEQKFTYLLGPIKIALRPRIITTEQLADLQRYCAAMWDDSVRLEQMWFAGELDEYIDIEDEELEIARLQPWRGGGGNFFRRRSVRFRRPSGRAMTLHVNPDWWKTLFDEFYLVTDARTVCNDETTRREVDVFGRLLPMAPGDRVLDLCGGHGRHSLELCRRGYRRCTVLDYSEALLRIGSKNAVRRHYSIRFAQGDARRTRLESESYDHVLLLGNSLGYIADVDADLLILKESRRLLRPGGWLLLDVTNGETIRTRLSPNAWHEIDEDVMVCRQREIRNDCVCSREMLLSKERGMIRDETYRIRLYGARELADLVNRAGFHDAHVHNMDENSDPGVDLGCMNHRLLVVARR